MMASLVGKAAKKVKATEPPVELLGSSSDGFASGSDGPELKKQKLESLSFNEVKFDKLDLATVKFSDIGLNKHKDKLLVVKVGGKALWIDLKPQQAILKYGVDVDQYVMQKRNKPAFRGGEPSSAPEWLELTLAVDKDSVQAKFMLALNDKLEKEAQVHMGENQFLKWKPIISTMKDEQLLRFNVRCIVAEASSVLPPGVRRGKPLMTVFDFVHGVTDGKVDKERGFGIDFLMPRLDAHARLCGASVTAVIEVGCVWKLPEEGTFGVTLQARKLIIGTKNCKEVSLQALLMEEEVDEDDLAAFA